MFSIVTGLIIFAIATFWTSNVDPNRMISHKSGVRILKVTSKIARLMRALWKIENGEYEEIKEIEIPSKLTTQEDKIQFIDEQIKFWKQEITKYSKGEGDEKEEEEEKEKGTYNLGPKGGRKTEIVTHNLNEYLKKSTSSSVNEKEGYGLKSNFKPLPINKKDELRNKFILFKYGAAIVSRKIGFGFTSGIIFQIMWLIGMILTLLSLCGVLSNEYSLAVFLCFPTIANFGWMNAVNFQCLKAGALLINSVT